MQLFPTKDDPRYVMGHAVTIGAYTIYILFAITLWAAYTSTNRNRRAGKEDWKIRGLSEEEVDDLGDESPRFVYAT